MMKPFNQNDVDIADYRSRRDRFAYEIEQSPNLDYEKLADHMIDYAICHKLSIQDVFTKVVKNCMIEFGKPDLHKFWPREAFYLAYAVGYQRGVFGIMYLARMLGMTPKNVKEKMAPFLTREEYYVEIYRMDEILCDIMEWPRETLSGKYERS